MSEKDLLIVLLEQVFGTEKPLARMLRTPNGYYLYDTGTNKILACRKEVYLLLDNLLNQDFHHAVDDYISLYGEARFIEASKEIVEAMEKEKILSAKKATRFGLSGHFKNLKDLLKSEVQGINLEVTQECNLRCGYCIYQDHFTGKRNYSSKEMSFDTACKAIRLLKDHSSGKDTLSIGVYGGEPLKKFSLIRECVRYAKEIFPREQKIGFNVTTNAALLTPEAADFLVKEGVNVTVSLDGPREFHDRFRTDAKGNGSFDKTLRGLKLLSEKYNRSEKKGRLLINVVYTPPFSGEKMDTINRFFRGLEWLPGNVHIISSYPADNSIPPGYTHGDGAEEDEPLFDWAFKNYRTGFEKSDALVKGQIEERFAKFIQRPVLSEPVDRYMLNGCCVPGQKKNYITADGYIQVCEKMPGNSPPLGHVDTGFDYETIERIYIREYAQKSLPVCAGCWGLRLCDVCYLYVFNEKGQLDIDKKSRHCASVMAHVEQSLCHFVTLLEENPGKLDYLKHFNIK